jgi:hypothetical protein
MANREGRLNQTKFSKLDALYKMVPSSKCAEKQFTVGILKGKHRNGIMSAEVDPCISPVQKRITIKINGIAHFTLRFTVNDGLWTAVTTLSWAQGATFDGANQFAQQYFDHLSTGKKQSGIRQQPQLPLFNEVQYV